MDGRRKKVLIVLGAGSLVLFWRLYVLFTDYWPTAAEARPASFVDAGPPSLDRAGSDATSEIWAAQALVADQPWGRDPFSDVPWAWHPSEVPGSNTPPGATPPPAPKLHFTGVSRSGDQWLAAIGGRVVRIGDVVADHYEVVRIDARSVALARGGWMIEYALGSADVLVHRRMEEQ